jgi:hypothetical protein
MKLLKTKSVEVKRGIVGRFFPSETLCIDTAKHCYPLNEVYNALPNVDERVLGVVIEERFNLCYEIFLENGKKVFGYFISSNIPGHYLIQEINIFNRSAYNPFETTYSLGEIFEVNPDEIMSTTI